jgi:aerobic carbon-monoxide dehydrogenase small subunit
MKPVGLTVNAIPVVETVEPRMHLADLLRDRLGLTGTHLRCEQGACGVCTLLIDGQPARSCITYAVLCEGAQITTIEGLENDPVMIALRRAFTAEHGLQCGFCTPGMLITARDIVTRLPDADERRVRLELSGNLCRCTGYVGIVRAIRRVLDERRAGALAAAAFAPRGLGPVGSRHGGPVAGAASAPLAAAIGGDKPLAFGSGDLGLAGKKPNIEIRQSFVIARPQREVWDFFAQAERVVPCMPGATLSGSRGDRLQGQLAIKLGPIAAAFNGEARMIRDEARQRSMILGAGRDRLSASRASAEIEYRLSAEQGAAATRVDITVRALLLGPLAQFGRSAIVSDLAARIGDMFARNLERRMAGSSDAMDETTAAIPAGALLRAVIAARVKKAFARLLGKFSR